MAGYVVWNECIIKRCFLLSVGPNLFGNRPVVHLWIAHFNWAVGSVAPSGQQHQKKSNKSPLAAPPSGQPNQKTLIRYDQSFTIKHKQLPFQYWHYQHNVFIHP